MKRYLVFGLIFCLIMVSGCLNKTSSEIEEDVARVIDNISETSEKKGVAESTFLTQVIRYSSGDYECKIIAPKDLEVIIYPKGQNFVISLKNIGEEAKIIKGVEAQIDQRRNLTKREVNREIVPEEELLVTFKDRGQGQVLPKIYSVEVIVE